VSAAIELDWIIPLETRKLALFFVGMVLLALALGVAVIAVSSIGLR